MPSYVRTRLLDAREFVLGELPFLRDSDPAYKPAILEDIRKLVPFDYFYIGGLDLEGCMVGCGIMLLSDLPDELREAYSEGSFHEIDPLVRRLSPSSPNGHWIDLPKHEIDNPTVKPLVELLAKFGIGNRAIFSKWNSSDECYGMACFFRDAPFTDAEFNILKWFGTRLHSELSKPLLRDYKRQLTINASELVCLKWASQGLTSDEIADQTGYSKETINSYFKSAAKKLGAKSRSQAIADALRIGLID